MADGLMPAGLIRGTRALVRATDGRFSLRQSQAIAQAVVEAYLGIADVPAGYQASPVGGVRAPHPTDCGCKYCAPAGV